MKFICNRYLVWIFVIFIASKYVIFSDYKRFVESNVAGTIAKIEVKLDKAKETVQELDQFKDKNCQDMMLSLQKIVALSPTINSIYYSKWSILLQFTCWYEHIEENSTRKRDPYKRKKRINGSAKHLLLPSL